MCSKQKPDDRGVPPARGGTPVPARRLARRRAWKVFAGVTLGILLGRGALGLGIDALPTPSGDAIGLSPVLFGAAGLLASLILLVPSGAARAVTLLGAVLLGMGVACARLGELPYDHLLRLTAHAGPADPAVLVRLEGLVRDRPDRDVPPAGTLDAELVRFGGSSRAFTLRADTLLADGGVRTRVSGAVRVFASGLEDGEIHPGDRVSVLGLLRGPSPPMNPGEPDTIAWARQSGFAGSLTASKGTIERVEPRSIRDRVVALRARLDDRYRAAAARVFEGDHPGAPVVRAMLLGERSPDGRDDAVFARTGVSHLLAISGFHLAVLVGLTVGLVRLAGDRPRLEAAVGLVCVLAYAALVPARTPIVRAALLAGVLLVAHGMARKYDRRTLLAWIGVAILLVRPMDATTLGFQLTLGVTVLLVWLADVRHPWVMGAHPAVDRSLLPEPAWWVRWAMGLRSLVVTTLLVWLASAPAILWHTGSFNPLAPLAVVIATPIAVGIQVLGMAGLLLDRVSEPLGAIGVGGALAAGRALAGVSRAFDGLGASRVLPPVSVAWAIGATGGVLFLIARARLRDWRPWLAVGLALAWLGVEVRVSGSLAPGQAARVDMLHVGDGSCLLVRTGRDAVLWDAGSLRPGLGVRELPRAVRTLGAARVRTALVTHANIDHYAALPDLVRPLGLERVLVSAPSLAGMMLAPADSAEGLFLAEMAAAGVAVEPVSAGATLALGDATLRVLWPAKTPPVSIRAANDRSLVARLEVPTEAGERRALLVGDIQRAAMLLLMARDETEGDVLDAEITELAHHGSHHAVAEDFLLTVSPRAVLQSTGRSRAHDRRWNGVKRTLVRERGGSWGITARDGALWAAIRRDGEIVSGSVRSGR